MGETSRSFRVATEMRIKPHIVQENTAIALAIPGALQWLIDCLSVQAGALSEKHNTSLLRESLRKVV